MHKKLLVIKEGKHSDTEMYIKAIGKEAKKRNVEVDVLDLTDANNLKTTILLDCFKEDCYNGIIIANPISKDKEKLLFNFVRKQSDKDLDNYTGYTPHQNCTLEAIKDILKEKNINIAEQDVVVIGRHLGKEIADYMEKQDATVTVCHSKTRHLKLKTVMADIVICCADANKKILTPDMVTEHTLVIDVGGNVEGTFKNIVTFREIGRRNINNIFKHMEV